jgi:arylsulfatase
MDPHGPYQPPPEFQREFREEPVESRRAKKLWRRTVDKPETISPTGRETLIDLYDAEIRYTDEMVGRLVDDMAERGILDESLLIIAADHGDLFGAHELYGHPRHLYDELIHVPLLIRTPDGQNVTVDQPVENVDIAPTILDTVGVTIPSAFAGQSLSVDSRNEDTGPLANVAISEARGEDEDSNVVRTAVRAADTKLHVEADGNANQVLQTELYDISVDPAEESPIENSDSSEQLLDLYRTHRLGVDDTADDDDQSHMENVDEVVEDRLRELGYK